MIARLLSILFVVSMFGSVAEAHGWYSETGCCGGDDCGELDPAWVTPVKDGYHVVMTLEQTRRVNPKSEAPIDTVVPWASIKKPPKNATGGKFHACLYEKDRSGPLHGIICFFELGIPAT